MSGLLQRLISKPKHWQWPVSLRGNGVLGMNRRNISYIARYNPRRLYPLVDNKLKTKMLLQGSDIQVPDLIAVVQQQHDIRQLVSSLAQHQQFVIKPAKGSGGKGILVIKQHDGKQFIKSSGASISAKSLERHVSNILSGLYSLGGDQDVALVENMIRFDPVFSDYSYEGVPDIRVIVCRGYPVMAMMRLSTHASDGKANLHQGAVGVGLNLANGKALHAVQYGKPVTHHPDTGADLNKLQVPHWQSLLIMAASCYEQTGMGYLGTDIVLDKQQGPMLLELNARPGLAIQIANGEGLLKRLKRIDQQPFNLKQTPLQRTELAQSWFGVTGQA